MKKQKGITPKVRVIISAFSTLVILGLLCVVALVIMDRSVVSAASGKIYDTDDAELIDSGTYDCILVLGAGVRVDGRPSDMLADRILTGIALYKNGVAPKLLMSGDHGRTEYDEVNTMKSYAIDRGVKSSDIFMDHAGFSTYESLYRAKAVFGAAKVVIVSQSYHLPRALYIADKLGIEAVGVSADIRTYRGQSYRDAREMLARAKDVFGTYMMCAPKYLGERIDITLSGDVTNDK